MDINPKEIEQVVRAVLTSIDSSQSKTPASSVPQKVAEGVFNELDDAVAAARQAQQALKTIAMRNLAIGAIRKAG